MNRLRILALACTAALPLFAGAAEPSAVSFEWNARLRHEHVDDAAFARDADATTLRLRAGVRWQMAPTWQAFLEGEAVAAAGDDYNSGANRRTAFPGIGDPEAAEINQAWVRGTFDGFNATVGRQRVQRENQRWIGPSGWRQNEQTFDALALEWKPAPSLAVNYEWLDRVHRSPGNRAVDPLARHRDLDGHVLHAAWTHGMHRVVGYGLAIEDRDVPAASTRTLGLRYVLPAKAGARRVGLVADVARQVDHADNPSSFSHAYWLLEPALAMKAATLRLGWEHLGGDGRHALQAPLATLHSFNGWADKFTTTPAAGLDDRYVSATGSHARTRARGALEWNVAWHDYRADTGGVRYGRELDASLAIPMSPRWRALAKVADYRADRYARDTTKLWLQVEWVSPAR